jgi:hypothetical protein
MLINQSIHQPLQTSELKLESLGKHCEIREISNSQGNDYEGYSTFWKMSPGISVEHAASVFMIEVQIKKS